MKRSVNIVLLAAALTLVSGCVTAPWSRLDTATTTEPDQFYTVELPAGWVRAEMFKDRVMITRDGIPLQFIEVTRRPGDQAFPQIERGIPTGTLPLELAEMQIAEYKRHEQLAALEVLANLPATLGGLKGYRLHTRYRTGAGLRYEILTYGVASAEGYFTLTYRAPTLHYFQRDLPVFDTLVRSFRLAGKAT